MTDSPETPSPVMNVAVAKGIALGLGVLLLGGTALMIVLLLTQKSEPEVGTIPPIELQAGEKVSGVTSLAGQTVFVIDAPDGSQRVLLVNFATGERNSVEIFHLNEAVTD